MDLKEIQQLVELLAETDISEIEVREEKQTVRITRQVAVAAGAVQMAAVPPPAVTYLNAPPVAQEPTQQENNNQPPAQRDEDAAASASANAMTITSPMVGTYYHAASPDALPFVSRGDLVKKGQVVCIIEAMKLMNPIDSEYSGRIVSILKENASPVEYGETLFIIEPV